LCLWLVTVRVATNVPGLPAGFTSTRSKCAWTPMLSVSFQPAMASRPWNSVPQSLSVASGVNVSTNAAESPLLVVSMKAVMAAGMLDVTIGTFPPEQRIAGGRRGLKVACLSAAAAREHPAGPRGQAGGRRPVRPDHLGVNERPGWVSPRDLHRFRTPSRRGKQELDVPGEHHSQQAE